MTASLLNGKHVASKLKNMIKNDVSLFIKHNNRAPGLAVILVGDDPASSIYVNNKRKACLELGFKSFYYSLSLQTFEDELLLLIETLNGGVGANRRNFRMIFKQNNLSSTL